MQRGTIIKHRRSWTLLYYDVVIRDGERKRIRVSKKLAVVSKEFPTKTSVKVLADKFLAPINDKSVQPESSLLVTDFIENFYFPAASKTLRPSTFKGYKIVIYGAHLKSRLRKSKLKLRDFRTVHGQRILRDIPHLGHRSLQHVKSFLSGVFKFAKREGFLDGLNPMQDVQVPGGTSKFKGVAYSLNDVEDMLEKLENQPTACDVIVLLSLTGLRQSEARALRWSDWDENNQTLHIQRSMWGRHLHGTKNIRSEASIPVLSLLQEMLTARRERVNPKPDDFIFTGPKGAPINFHNLEIRVIKPALTIKPEVRREAESNGFKLPEDIKWSGYHGFRRGLATNLISLGVKPVVIAAMLRNDIAVTLEYYVKTPDGETREAMQKLESLIRERQNAGVTPLIGSAR